MRPRLTVLIVVDQMRRDYVDRFERSWTGGFRRLVDEGALFSNAAYPYVSTWTCPGHATVGTGAYPAVHGIMQNAWFDRALGRTVGCADDRDTPLVGYGVQTSGGSSPLRLLVPTYAEELRAQVPGSRTAALSLKDRAAIMLAGHQADAVVWFSNGSRGWATSTQYAAEPLPFLEDFIARHPIGTALGSIWRKRLEPSYYETPDDGLGEDPPRGWKTRFPHRLNGGSRRTDNAFYARWRASPSSDAYLELMAEATVEALALGARQGTDFLGISFSALDLVGHDFGPESQEVQDVLAHLDDTLGRLFTFLDEQVGPDRYVVALTSDHGVTPIPEQTASQGVDAGRISSTDAGDAVEQALEAFLGPGPHVARVASADVYFEPDRAAAILSNPAAIDAARNALLSIPGIRRVFTADDLTGARRAEEPSDDDLRAARLTYVPGRSGDLLIVARTGWVLGSAATNHGSLNANDQEVPIVLMGAGIRTGRYAERASPADIAPTLAALTGVTLDRAQGRVLNEALDH